MGVEKKAVNANSLTGADRDCLAPSSTQGGAG